MVQKSRPCIPQGCVATHLTCGLIAITNLLLIIGVIKKIKIGHHLVRQDYSTTFLAHSGQWPIFLRETPHDVAEWSKHSAAMCSRALRALWPGFTPQPRHVRLPKNN